jgi:hypothetical protein
MKIEHITTIVLETEDEREQLNRGLLFILDHINRLSNARAYLRRSPGKASIPLMN